MQIQKSQIYMYDWRDENTEEIRMLSHEQQLAIANSCPRVESFLRQEDKRRANPFPLVLEVLGEA